MDELESRRHATLIGQTCGHCGRVGCEKAHVITVFLPNKSDEEPVWTERAICRCGKPVVGNEWHMCGSDIRRFGDEEETQALLSDWCAVCGLAKVYCRGHS